MLSEREWDALLRRIRRALEQIVTGSGFGEVTIQCSAGTPKELRVSESMRFRDSYLDEDAVPQVAGS